LKDLYILEPGGECRFNVLDYERRHGASTADLTQACMTFKETLTRTQGGGGGGGGDDKTAYFPMQERLMLPNASHLVLMATGELEPWDIYSFIQQAAVSPQELAADKWKDSYHFHIISAAHARAVTASQKKDFELAEQYFTQQLPRMNNDTRTSI